ncbi:MAG: hypothetical protein J7578_20660 [Chitinophagaceae bacterium]|nr:hypothetical protein [Chitinophagaceae bacterium]
MQKTWITSTFLLLLFIPFLSSAQLATIQEPGYDQKTSYGFTMIMPENDKIFSLEYEYRYYWVPGVEQKWKNIKLTEYDKDLNIVSSQNIEPLHKTSFEGLLLRQLDLRIFCRNSKGEIIMSETDLRLKKTAPTPTFLFKPDKHFYKFYCGFSADSNFSYILTATGSGKDIKYQGVVLNREYKVINKFAFKMEKIAKTIQSTLPFLSNAGSFCVLYAVRTKRNKDIGYIPYAYFLTEINDKGEGITTHLDNLPTGRIDNMSLRSENNILQFTAFLIKNENEGIKSVITGQFNSRAKKITDLKEVDLTVDPFWQSSKDPWISSWATNGIAYGNLFNSYRMENGSEIVVMQNCVERTIEYWSGNSTKFKTLTNGYFITAICFSPDLKIRWLHTIPLSQSEASNRTWVGHVSNWQRGKGLYILFNDNDKNVDLQPGKEIQNAALDGAWGDHLKTYVVKITEDGKFSRSPAGSYRDKRLHFAPGASNTSFGNKVLFTSLSGGIGRPLSRPAFFIFN